MACEACAKRRERLRQWLATARERAAALYAKAKANGQG